MTVSDQHLECRDLNDYSLINNLKAFAGNPWQCNASCIVLFVCCDCIIILSCLSKPYRLSVWLTGSQATGKALLYQKLTSSHIVFAIFEPRDTKDIDSYNWRQKICTNCNPRGPRGSRYQFCLLISYGFLVWVMVWFVVFVSVLFCSTHLERVMAITNDCVSDTLC